MGGLSRICKHYGKAEVIDKDGKKVIWIYDYANDKPRLRSEMTKDEIDQSNKAKFKDKSENDGWDDWYKKNVKN